jgi:predicted MFS family arabinose efflux permease
VGITSVAAQILVPFSASLAGEAERGRVVGTVMSGLLLGILLARTAAGVVSQALGWRWVYGIAAALMVALAVLLSRVLPAQPPQVKMRYGALLRSVASLLREEPVVRRRGAYGALTFGAFSVFWTSAAFLLSGPPYHYTEAIIGLFGLLGVAGALAASVAGRLADRGWVRSSTGTFIAAAFPSYGLLALGSHSLPALVAGIVVLDLGAQGTHILNQSRIYTLASEARTRLNSAYMTIYFAGGALGSAASTVAYSRSGWLAVCVVGAVMCGLAFLLWCTELLHR